MLTAQPTPAIDSSARLDPPKASWQVIAQRKKLEQLALLPSEWILPTAELARWEVDADPRQIINECGLLSDAEAEMTRVDDALELRLNLSSGRWSALAFTRASAKRAALAHQLTNCLTELLFDRAFARAAELDAHFAATGNLVGPLHGWPISVKDQLNIAGYDTTMGFVSLVDQPADANSTLIDLLESLGAIIIAKTNVPQTLMAEESNNFVFGRTLNPRNRELISGGSSGGEGALVTLGGSILGIGTDFGGSIRKPSVYCGLYGLRPSVGRLPYAGVSNVMKGFEAIKSTIGPLARSASTIDAFMRAVIGAQPWMADCAVVERPWKASPEPWRLKVAVMFDDRRVHNHPPIQRALEETVAALRKSGHQVVEWAPFDHAVVQRLFGELASADGGADLRTFVAPSGEPIIPEAFPFDTTSAKTVYELSQLVRQRDAFRQLVHTRWAASGEEDGHLVDAILCPAAPHVALAPAGKPRAGELITWTTIWSLVDLPVCAIPVGTVDPTKDAARSLAESTFSSFDEAHWASYAPEKHKRAPIGLQLVSPRRLGEDELMSAVRLVDEARAAFIGPSE